MIEFVGIRPKTQAYLIDGYGGDDYEKNKLINKKAKRTKKCVIKRRFMFKNYRDCFFDKIILKPQRKI